MKKMLKSFADQMLSREQMKSVKGAGDMYCSCGGGAPVKNPDPDNMDCMYVCTGASPYNSSWGMTGSAGVPTYTIPGTPCTSYTSLVTGNGTVIGGYSNCP